MSIWLLSFLALLAVDIALAAGYALYSLYRADLTEADEALKAVLK